MNKFFMLLLLMIVILGAPKFLRAKPMDNRLGYVYVPFTRGYQFPGTIRVGRNEYEVGLFSQTSLAVSKVFRGKSPYFVAVGPALQPFISRINIGLAGAMGFEWEFWKIFRLRGEFNAVGFINRAYTDADANLGIVIQF